MLTGKSKPRAKRHGGSGTAPDSLLLSVGSRCKSMPLRTIHSRGYRRSFCGETGAGALPRGGLFPSIHI